MKIWKRIILIILSVVMLTSFSLGIQKPTKVYAVAGVDDAIVLIVAGVAVALSYYEYTQILENSDSFNSFCDLYMTNFYGNETAVQDQMAKWLGEQAVPTGSTAEIGTGEATDAWVKEINNVDYMLGRFGIDYLDNTDSEVSQWLAGDRELISDDYKDWLGLDTNLPTQEELAAAQMRECYEWAKNHPEWWDKLGVDNAEDYVREAYKLRYWAANNGEKQVLDKVNIEDILETEYKGSGDWSDLSDDDDDGIPDFENDKRMMNGGSSGVDWWGTFQSLGAEKGAIAVSMYTVGAIGACLAWMGLEVNKDKLGDKLKEAIYGSEDSETIKIPDNAHYYGEYTYDENNNIVIRGVFTRSFANYGTFYKRQWRIQAEQNFVRVAIYVANYNYMENDIQWNLYGWDASHNSRELCYCWVWQDFATEETKVNSSWRWTESEHSIGYPNVNIPVFTDEVAFNNYLRTGNVDYNDVVNYEEKIEIPEPINITKIEKGFKGGLPSSTTLPRNYLNNSVGNAKDTDVDDKTVGMVAIKDIPQAIEDSKTATEAREADYNDNKDDPDYVYDPTPTIIYQLQPKTEPKAVSEDKPSTGTKTDPSPGTQYEYGELFEIPDKIDIESPEGKGTNRNWKLIFPFCIPFDLIDLVKLFNVPAEAPKFSLPVSFDVGNFFGASGASTVEYTWELDFADYETLAKVVRVFSTVGYLVALMYLTSKVIKW